MWRKSFYKAGIYATPFHGGLSQGAQTRCCRSSGRRPWQVVVTTDLAARGIDIAQLPAVVNYDLPLPLPWTICAPHRTHRPGGRKRHGRELCDGRCRKGISG